MLLASCAGDLAPDGPPLGLDSSGSYVQIQIKHSGKCLEVASGNLVQSRCDSGDNQLFRPLVHSNDFQLQVKSTGRCLDVYKNSRDNLANVSTYRCESASESYTNQLMRAAVRDGDYAQLRFRHSGKCLDVERRSGADGANIIQYSCKSSSLGNQLFLLESSPENADPSALQTPDVDLPQGETLALSTNRRYLQTAAGTPVFIVADTMWGLATLSESEADTYFSTRKSQGFNTILGPVSWGNRYAVPGTGSNDSPKPQNSAFYDHLDMLITKARGHGLYIGFVVQWGDAPNMKAYGSDANARAYAAWLGGRFRHHSNVFWFASGEYTLSPEYESRYRALGEGLKGAVGTRQLVSIHPAGGNGYNQQSSSDYFHDSSWLDFNAIQTWTYDESTYKKTRDDWNESPVKPVFMSETKYEAEGADAFRMRRNAYWSVFAGSLGFGYGHGNIWASKRDGKDWRGALQAEGGNDMRHLHDLILSRSETPAGSVIYFDRRPDDGLIRRVDGGANPGQPSERGHVGATRDAGGKYFMVYLPTNGAARSVEVEMSRIAGSQARAWWYSPSTGAASAIGTFGTSGSRTFTTPGSAQDWVLVVDDVQHRWAAPGRYN